MSQDFATSKAHPRFGINRGGNRYTTRVQTSAIVEETWLSQARGYRRHEVRLRRPAMLNISAMVVGIVFVALAAANVVVMLEASQPTRTATTRIRLVAAHRAGGYLFVILFCLMAYSMSQRLAGVGITGHLPTYLVLHIMLVLALVPLVS